MIRALIIAAALLLTPWLAAQANEKQAETEADLQIVQQRGVSNATGSIGPDVYDRRFDVSTDNTCNAASDDSSNDGTPFAVVPIYSPTGATLVASTDNPGTDIADTVIFLYCDPFDPLSPELSLVAWDDDGGSGFLSAWDGSEGIVLVPDQQYFIVITSFDVGGVGGGNYELSFGGLNQGEEVLLGSPVLLPETVPVPTTSWLGQGLLILLLLVVSGVFLMRMRA